MGSAVKKVAKVAVSTVDPLNLSGKGAFSPVPGLEGKLGGAFDAITGKVNTPSGYNPNAAAFAPSKEQLEFRKTLKAQALGQDPTSVAQQQLQRGTDRNIAQIAGLAGGQRSNQGLALRQAFRAQAGANQEMAGQAAALRAQEMGAAQDAYSQDLIREQQSSQNLENTRAGIAGATQALQFQANQAKAQGLQNLIQTGAGAALMMSDENLKKDIKKASPKDLEDFAVKLKASKFKYKQPNGESYQDGEVTGIMAQDLEKSKIGKDMIVDSNIGKMVDMKRAVPATLAAISDIMKRIKNLENKKEKV